MDEKELQRLKYPIGKFIKPEIIHLEEIKKWILDIEELPDNMQTEVTQLSDLQLNWKYRPGGWTIKQVVHHCADSHINSFTRFKLALTEDTPTIKPYYEDRWAKMVDANDAPVEWSLGLLENLHLRWVYMLRNMKDNDFKKSFFHPELNRKIYLDETVGIYSWHSRHHLAQIKQAIKFNGEY